jgi:phosphomannomutase
MIAALHTIASVAESDLPLSALVSELDFFASSGEVNSTVRDHRRALDLVESAWVRRPGVTADHLDGLTIEHADWWFNLRPSNTEPLLRLNVEAEDIATMERVRDEVLAMLTEPAHG